MTANAVVQIAIYVAVLLLLVKPLGLYMARVYEGQPIGLDRVLGPVERLFYKLSGVKSDEGMDWKTYALAVILFSLVSGLVVYALQRLQAYLPLNPQSLGPVSPDLAFNTAVSFMTNTNWQNYGGETTLTYLTQMAALTVQNFVSAAAGMAVLAAVIRGFRSRSGRLLGNFWADLTRGTLYILLPMSIVVSITLVSQGVVQTFSGYVTETLLQPTTYQAPQTDANGNPVKDANDNPLMQTLPLTQTIVAVGPAASQIAIKQLGTNGGGFFSANSSHPFENPNAVTNFVEMLSILLISAGLCYTFGKMVGDTRQGWALLTAMTIVLVVLIGVATVAEQNGNPAFTTAGVDQSASALQSGGNMEGKEVRFGIVNSAIWATSTTAASNGSVNSMHDSYTPLGGFVPLAMLSLAEVIFGGVGCGLYGMLIFVIIAVFVAGLMVGRTPEYLGKKIESYEMKMASLTFLILPLLALDLTAAAVVLDVGKAGILNPGPHGFSEVLYAFMSQADNNGSAFAGLNGNTLFYNLTGAFDMLFGRFFMMIPPLAIAGSLAGKKVVPPGAGTLPTHDLLFIVWLLFVVVIVGALTFFPALALGPIVEQLIMIH